jgi:hypothetical protein
MESFYFLHVNRCSGRFFYKYLLKSLIEQINKNNKEFIRPKTDTKGWTHWGWASEIKESTYVMCILRDPILQFISYHVGFSNVKNKEDLLYNINLVNNLSSRNFLNWQDNRVNPSVNIDFDKDLIFKRLSRVNLLIDSEDVNIYTIDKINKKISLEFNVPEVVLEKNILDTDEFKSFGVKEIYESLNEDELSLIKKHNSIDIDLYEKAKTLFWKP